MNAGTYKDYFYCNEVNKLAVRHETCVVRRHQVWLNALRVREFTVLFTFHETPLINSDRYGLAPTCKCSQPQLV
jgi:hypothetical protein